MSQNHLNGDAKHPFSKAGTLPLLPSRASQTSPLPSWVEKGWPLVDMGQALLQRDKTGRNAAALLEAHNLMRRELRAVCEKLWNSDFFGMTRPWATFFNQIQSKMLEVQHMHTVYGLRICCRHCRFRCRCR